MFVARHLRANVQAALADTRVVVVLGARQVGKSTLVAPLHRLLQTAEMARLDYPAYGKGRLGSAGHEGCVSRARLDFACSSTAWR